MAVARGLATVITVSPGVTTGNNGYGGAAYSIGDVFGGGTTGTVMTLPAACPSSGGRVILESVSVTLLTATAAPLSIDLVFYDRIPSTSVGADNATYVLTSSTTASTNDSAKVIGRVNIPATATNWVTLSSGAIIMGSINAVGLLLQSDIGSVPSSTATDARKGNSDLYCHAIIQTAVTLAATVSTDVKQTAIFKIGFLQE